MRPTFGAYALTHCHFNTKKAVDRPNIRAGQRFFVSDSVCLRR